MSFDFRFEPPSNDELDDMSYTSCPFDFKCATCEYHCTPEEYLEDMEEWE